MQLNGFVLGIRINKSFAIEDKLGGIVDDILNHKNEAFGPDFFPKIQHSYHGRVLVNPETNNTLAITPQGITFNYNVKDSFENELNHFLNTFDEIILKGVIEKNEIRNINRLGFVIKSEISSKDSFLEEMFGVIGKHYDKPQSFSIRFNTHKKEPQKIEKIVTQDYSNQILTFDKAIDKEDFLFSVDYQKYFVPSLNILADLKKSFEGSFSKFCQKSFKQYKEKYLRNGSETESTEAA